MSKPRSPTGLARRPWYAWLELQYRLANEVIAHTLGESSKELEEVPSELRQQKRHAKLYEIVKFFYNQVESESGKDIKDEPMFAQSAEQNWDLARILGCIGGSYYGEQEISQTRWNKDLAAVKVAITSARDWFLRHDTKRRSKTPKNAIPNTPLQNSILTALDGTGLKKESLAAACNCEPSRLYRPGGLKELQEKGRVKNLRGIGYYRPDAPPDDR